MLPKGSRPLLFYPVKITMEFYYSGEWRGQLLWESVWKKKYLQSKCWQLVQTGTLLKISEKVPLTKNDSVPCLTWTSCYLPSFLYFKLLWASPLPVLSPSPLSSVFAPFSSLVWLHFWCLALRFVFPRINVSAVANFLCCLIAWHYYYHYFQWGEEGC